MKVTSKIFPQNYFPPTLTSFPRYFLICPYSSQKIAIVCLMLLCLLFTVANFVEGGHQLSQKIGIRNHNLDLQKRRFRHLISVMDRSWMYLAPSSSQTFVNGVQTFLNFAFERACVNGGLIKCPCTNCLNMKYKSRQTVLDHLICSGFRPEYLKWVYHGEGTTVASTSTTHNEEEQILHHEMHEMLDDIFVTEGGNGVEMHETASSNSEETNTRRSTFDDLVNEAEEKFLEDLLPEGNLVPKTTHQVKKIMANLGLRYEKIHSCPNGCMLFWDDKEKDEVCSFCGSSRWKVYEASPEDEESPPKKKASKILRTCERWKIATSSRCPSLERF
ncbi:putative Transposase-associated domain-containing protein [Helianthus annuus]|uniref:Transposase-associated domain-containing protein n=1 Tax=Helianthus annuus TaxID=4232 RepID=A0A9K3NV97_HELAN|nr:putative Transposase-associated domain-containing protein [Helianthus annuus]KAJ0943814.1 putative Transposase-associated domain-containing protein [Helianthus annuus]